MNKFFGECLCSKTAYYVEGKPIGLFFCHCSRCRKETGTIHGANLFLSDATLTFIRGQKNITKFLLKNTKKSSAFCQLCGSPMPRTEEQTNVVIPAGSLDPICEVSPSAHIHYASRALFEDRLQSIKKFEELPNE